MKELVWEVEMGGESELDLVHGPSLDTYQVQIWRLLRLWAFFCILAGLLICPYTECSSRREKGLTVLHPAFEKR